MNDQYGGILGNITGKDNNEYTGESRRKGVNLATIIDLKDPDGLGRVKCKFITVDTDMGDTEWAFVASPFAGKNYGMFFHPRAGDVVLLAYEDGDIHVPYVIGSIWWKDKNIDNTAPVPINSENEKSDIYKITTPNGHVITLSDKKDEEKVEVLTKEGHFLRLDDKNKKIELLSSDSNGITLDIEKGILSINCKEFNVNADGHTFNLSSNGASIDTKASVSVKGGSEVKVEGSGSVTVKGGSTVTVEGSGNTTVKGAALNLESTGIANLKGSMVKIG